MLSLRGRCGLPERGRGFKRGRTAVWLEKHEERKCIRRRRARAAAPGKRRGEERKKKKGIAEDSMAPRRSCATEVNGGAQDTANSGVPRHFPFIRKYVPRDTNGSPPRDSLAENRQTDGVFSPPSFVLHTNMSSGIAAPLSDNPAGDERRQTKRRQLHRRAHPRLGRTSGARHDADASAAKRQPRYRDLAVLCRVEISIVRPR